MTWLCGGIYKHLAFCTRIGLSSLSSLRTR